ncbi:hypothetical protein FEI13_18460 [Halomonas urmiana]|uniref:Uncharacterized protein n=1 Tax=Halomonas urmiana TaxID=490901 RepID=A0A5R8M6K0_9GAMM|nr:hypothetical protein [Halomonas urmiana]TLF45100.1 hypothetical protein FEI13_18460 [Halomonas urmiana]
MAKTSEKPSANELSTEQRIKLEHQLGIRRILIDRLLIGLLLALFGFIATLAIELFKVTTSDTRYFLEQRLEAAMDVRSEFTNVTNAAFKQTVAACSFPSRSRQSIANLTQPIGQLISELNNSALLFSQDYLNDANLVVNIFSGAAADPSAIRCHNRTFFSEVADYFTHITATEVHGEDRRWNGYKPLKFDKKKIDEIGVDKYFHKNIGAWLAGRNENTN